MKRRATGLVLAAGCLVASAVGVAGSRDGDRTEPLAPVLVAYPGASPEDIARYWSDARAALSPLLVYVKKLPNSIVVLRRSDGNASQAQAREALAMAESFATARDLISRVEVPAKIPPAIGELMQVACQLYRESALVLGELRSTDDVSKDLLVHRAAALHAVGDRVIDQVRRVLSINHLGKDQTPAEFRYAPPVPSVADIAGEVAVQRHEDVDVDRALGEASTLLAQLTSDGTEWSGGTATSHTLLRLAGALESDTAQQSEDVIGARLALLVALVAQMPEGNASSLRSNDSLLMLSNDIWNSARVLVAVPRGSMRELPAPKAVRSKVWTGGAFDGKPPPIKPGEGVGSGLDGGLPAVDPAAILKG